MATIKGNNNANNLVGTSSSDTISGLRGNDTLSGGAGNDILRGGDGNDVLIGGTGNDQIFGDNGFDEVRYSATTSGVTLTVNADGSATAVSLTDGTDTINTVEKFTLTSHNDMININTGPLNYTYDGGANMDRVTYNVAIDLNANLATGFVTGGGKQDTLLNIENLTTGSGNDTLVGNAGNNMLDGGAGNDILAGGAGNDTLTGGLGVDTADYSAVASSMTVTLATGTASGEGSDTLVGIENVMGGSGNDSLTGDANANSLMGGAGDDILIGGAGNDNLNGDQGTDEARYSATISNVALTVNADGSATAVSATDGTDAINTVEKFILTSYNDTVAVNAGPLNYIYDGSTGTDSVAYNTAIDLNANLATGLVSGDGKQDTLLSIENLATGSGNDVLMGNTGNNMLDGGAGNDVLAGGAGNDTLAGGLGVDSADYSAVASIMTVNLATGTASGEGSDILSGIENVMSGSGNDTLTGDANANSLMGGAGDDILIGGAGNDNLNGDQGTDEARYSATTSSVALTVAADGSATAVSATDGTDAINTVEKFTLTSSNDTVVVNGGPLNFIYSGGSGIDSVAYNTAIDLTANLHSTTGFVSGDGKQDALLSMENLATGAGNDVLTGNTGNNILDGGAGNDTLLGGFGNDTLMGGDGNDTASFASTSAAINASLISGTATGEGSDVLSGIENLIGGNGNDLLAGDANDNILNGGLGVDTADYSAATNNVTIDLAAGTASGEGSDSLLNMENAIGGSGDDILSGDANANNLNGGNGNDMLMGGAGNDILAGGLGNDTVSYAAVSANITANLNFSSASGDGSDSLSSIENIIGGSGNDSLTGNAEDNRLEGSMGNDVLFGDAGNDILDGGGDNDELYGYTGNDTLYGAAGDDKLLGDEGDDALYGGEGNDTLSGQNGNDHLDGGDGIDVADFKSAATTVSLVINLADGTATGNATAGSDTLVNIENVIAGRGNDVLMGDANDNVLDGYTGVDWVDYSAAAESVAINLATNVASGVEVGTDTLVSIENARGGAGDDILIGGAGSNILEGGAGNDTLNGGSGVNTLHGGAGSDTVDYAAATTNLNVNLTTGTISGLTSVDTLVDIENMLSGSGNDVFIGSGADNLFSGGAGDDTFIADAGNDVFDGGIGIDTADYSAATQALNINLANGTITGSETGMDSVQNIEKVLAGSGNDTFIAAANTSDFEFAGNSGNDTVDYSQVSDNLTIDLLAQRVTGANIGTHILSSVESAIGGSGDDQLIGTTASELLAGGSGNDVLWGNAGNDTLDGGDGDDVLVGGMGNDLLQGGAGHDKADYSQEIVAVTANFALGTTSSIMGNDSWVSIEEAVTGNSNDTFIGGSNDDTMDGGAGIDTVYFNGVMAGVVVDLANGSAQGQGMDTLLNIENVTGSDSDDTLIGDASTNILDGGAGNDLLISGGGNNTLKGGTGSDTVSYAATASGVAIDLVAGTALSAGPTSDTLSTDTLVSIENMIGSAYEDGLAGDAGDNNIYAGDGHDVLYFTYGNDVIDGGNDWDSLYLGDAYPQLELPANTYTIDNPFLTVQFGTPSGEAGSVVGYQANTVIYNIESVNGTDYSENMTGNDDRNYLFGGDGDDRLLGMGGADHIDGEDGNDELWGGDGNDVLWGGAGNDVLNGEAGNDRLGGGDGNDTFVFSAGSGNDWIEDFTAGVDTLDLSSFNTSAENLLDSDLNNGYLTTNAGGQTEIHLGTDTITLTLIGTNPLDVQSNIIY